MKVCTIDGCGRAFHARGFCTMHLGRLQRDVDIHQPVQKRVQGDVTTRLWGHVTRTDGCWEWTAHRGAKGYGYMKAGGTRPLLVHRVSWELHFGPIPGDLCVLHRCDNPPCVRPDHLFLGTRADNNRDMQAKGRYANLRTHPELGQWGDDHPFRLHPERIPRGERCGTAKFTAAIVLAIRERRERDGLSAAKLGRLFGVSETQVYRIIRREVWAHI